MKLSNIKNLLLPIGVIVVIMVLGFMVANFLLTKINTTLASTREQETKNQVLKDRLNTLQELSEEIKSSVNVATLALPENNPSVLIINQLKSIADNYGVVMSNLSVSTLGSAKSESSQLATYDISFEIEAPDFESVANYIKNLSTVTPLLNLSTLKISLETGSISANIKLTGFSSPFPLELPALDAPISGLTAEEEETLNTIESFTHPIVSSSGSPQETEPREDPFSLNI